MWKKILDIIFPQFCLNCGREGSLLCQDCLSLIRIATNQYCPFCSKPVKGMKCSKHQTMNLDGLFSAAPLEDFILNKAIKKFRSPPFLKELAEPLAYLIISYFELSENRFLKDKRDDSLFIPIPLNKKREKWRGFNQAQELAVLLSNYYNIPLSANLFKIKKSRPQRELALDQRKNNVFNSFALKEPKEVKKKTIFLIDDIFSSGWTMEEASKTLKKAGAKEVWGISVARENLKNYENKRSKI